MAGTGIPAADIAQGVIGLGEAAVGLINAGKTKRIAAQLEKTRPKRAISEFAKDDLALSQSELAQGMSAKSTKAYEDATSREMSASLSSILKGGGDVNSVGAVYGKAQEGSANLALIQDNLRMNQVNNMVRSYAAMNDEQQKNFEFNDWNPWADKAQANAQARMGANNQVMQGIGTLGGAVMNYGQQKHEENIYDKYFNSRGPSSTFIPERFTNSGIEPMTTSSSRVLGG